MNIDRDCGFDENNIIESNKELFDDLTYKTAITLELLAQAIRDGNKELFDDLTYNATGQGAGIVVDLDEVHSIIFRSI